MYEDGLGGLKQEEAEAVKGYGRAAEQGNADAQMRLGVMYVDGRGAQDDAEAVKWYRKAAEHGRASAQAVLGVMYESGLGVPPDNVLAHMWLSLAAAQGDGDAAKLRDSLARFMTPDQIAEAQRLAREWQATK
jgi:TPR repeat protein